MIYREMVIADYDAVYALWQSVPGIGLSEADRPEAIAAYLRRNPGQSFVCVSSDGEIAGTILCGNDGRRAYIHHTAVGPNFRRQGIAKELVRLALERQAQLGIRKCHLMAFIENASGQAFWREMGFSLREDLAFMSRSLP